MTDITELAQSLKAAAEKATPGKWHKGRQDPVIGIIKIYARTGSTKLNCIVKTDAHEVGFGISEREHKANAELIALANPTNILSLVEAQEKAQTINAAAEKLVRCKGRYHSEQNYRVLAALFGVNTPDLPTLENENVHYADAAEIEIAALRQRITELESEVDKWKQESETWEQVAEKQLATAIELESRTVTVKPMRPGHITVGGEKIGIYMRDEVDEFIAALTAAGIKWEAE